MSSNPILKWMQKQRIPDWREQLFLPRWLVEWDGKQDIYAAINSAVALRYAMDEHGAGNLGDDVRISEIKDGELFNMREAFKEIELIK